MAVLFSDDYLVVRGNYNIGLDGPLSNGLASDGVDQCSRFVEELGAGPHSIEEEVNGRQLSRAAEFSPEEVQFVAVLGQTESGGIGQGGRGTGWCCCGWLQVLARKGYRPIGISVVEESIVLSVGKVMSIVTGIQGKRGDKRECRCGKEQQHRLHQRK